MFAFAYLSSVLFWGMLFTGSRENSPTKNSRGKRRFVFPNLIAILRKLLGRCGDGCGLSFSNCCRLLGFLCGEDLIALPFPPAFFLCDRLSPGGENGKCSQTRVFKIEGRSYSFLPSILGTRQMLSVVSAVLSFANIFFPDVRYGFSRRPTCNCLEWKIKSLSF